MVGLLEQAFQEMLASSYDLPPPPRLVIEMRKFFLAGAVSLYGIAPDEIPAGPKTERMLFELQEFALGLKKS